ncbi:amino acid ABC transporter permease [Gulosibacter chungangensis]|uniref:Amino acid ABC transporter permease n=1 Tax=Gulosibacter chungangensis TaxID=979746 RepID=A0A7J5BF34_9MICO|nr:amino acid ABC transporter permease [Gulosibacter chungangensis]KAB1644834.1 amino acid ABC transporter permease [Gulosibacter chungangensis]
MNAFFAALPAALGTTLLVTVVSLAIGCLAAFPLMLARVSENAILSNFAKLIIEIIRGVPPVVWVFVIYFGIQIGAFRFAPLPTAIIAFSLITAAYIAEVYRGGFLSVKSGQFEAAAAIGLNKTRTFIDVISPQMIRVAIPGVVTYAVGLLKDTSIMSIIGVVDIVFVASRAMRSTGDAITPFLIAALLYMVISIPLGLLGRRLYTSMKKKVA